MFSLLKSEAFAYYLLLLLRDVTGVAVKIRALTIRHRARDRVSRKSEAEESLFIGQNARHVADSAQHWPARRVIHSVFLFSLFLQMTTPL